MCKRLLILSLLFFLSPLPCWATDYTMTDQQKTEFLTLITELKQSLANRQIQYEALKINNKQIEEQLAISAQKITDLENSVNNKEVLLQDLNQEKEQIEKDLTDLKKELDRYRWQNRLLKITAAIEAVIIAGLAL